MTANQISVFVENKPGRLARLTGYLSENKINMRAFSVAETRDFGVVRMIVDDPYAASNVLKNADYVVSITPVLAVEIPDEPGGLLRVLDVLGKADINIAYTYAFLAKKKDSAYVIFRVDDNEKVVDLLLKNGIHVIDQDEMLRL